MAYTAYESASDKAMDGVEALCKHLTASGAFSTTTQPTLAEVEAWLTEGYRLINVLLMEYGYDQDQTDTDVKGALQPYNVWYAAAQAEYSQASAGFAEGSGGRAEMFMEMFWGTSEARQGKASGPHPGIAQLIQSAGFSRLGATKNEELSGHLTAGGISRSDKNTIKSDSDMVQYSFRRGQFDNPGSVSVRETRADLD